jgi:predicted nucleotide-binding protein
LAALWVAAFFDLLLRLFRPRRDTTPPPEGGTMPDKRVFIVHGRNHAIRNDIERYLTKDLKLETVVMEDGAHRGRTLPEKFEEIAKACSFAVFILSGDDELICKRTRQELKRARQNVILEVGYFWGALGRRGQWVLLVEDGVELPSDLQGLGWIGITPDLARTKLELRKELSAAGII